MKYKFLEITPVSAAALDAAVAPHAEAGWRLDRVELTAPSTSKRPSYALVVLALGSGGVRDGAERTGSPHGGKSKRRRVKLIELGELDWGEHPDVAHLELDHGQAAAKPKRAGGSAAATTANRAKRQPPVKGSRRAQR